MWTCDTDRFEGEISSGEDSVGVSGISDSREEEDPDRSRGGAMYVTLLEVRRRRCRGGVAITGEATGDSKVY